MAKNLLNGVNEVLYRVRILEGDTGPLNSLTSSSIQVYINLAIQVWNEIVDELYSYSNVPKPRVTTEGTITLATSDRDYALNSSLTRLYFPLINETTGHVIEEYPGGWWELVKAQPVPSSYSGQAKYAAIRPDDEELYLDAIPSATENGDVYKYRYDKDVSLALAADTFPFDDVVYRALRPAAAELWRRDRQQGFDAGLFGASLGRASRFLTKVAPSGSYLPRQVRGTASATDPYSG